MKGNLPDSRFSGNFRGFEASSKGRPNGTLREASFIRAFIKVQKPFQKRCGKAKESARALKLISALLRISNGFSSSL
jgi:hypothetical protein